MKLYELKTFDKVILFIIIMIFASCSTNSSKQKSNELIVGGLYVTQNDDALYSVSKILVLSEYTVHICMYANKFKLIPKEINSADLKPFIGYAPIEKKGFLRNNPILIIVEKVSEEELEGYNYYMEDMDNQ